MIGLVVAGVCLVGVAALVGRLADLSSKLKLDVGGERAPGQAESTGDGVYRLRYEHPGGKIYSCRYTGGFGLQRVRGEESEITVVFAPDNPTEFQPAGVSYIPAGITGILFVSGMICILHTRHMMTKMRIVVRNKTLIGGVVCFVLLLCGCGGKDDALTPVPPAPKPGVVRRRPPVPTGAGAQTANTFFLEAVAVRGERDR